MYGGRPDRFCQSIITGTAVKTPRDCIFNGGTLPVPVIAGAAVNISAQLQPSWQSALYP